MNVADEQLLETTSGWLAEGRAVASATVVRTWRSSPRPAGSRMIVDDAGRFAGSVSGGCVEAAVVEAAREFLRAAKPCTLRFGVTNEMAWEVGLPCGGKIEVFVGPVDAEVTRRLIEARNTRSVYALLTDLSTGEQRLVAPTALPDDLFAAERDFLERHGDQDISSVIEHDGRRTFVELLGPPVHLIVVGAVHLTQLLSELARLAGFEVTVVDPRRSFATPERFPDVRIVSEWPAAALHELGLDRRTAVVTLSHDAKIDEPALATALASDCFYIGALGGRKSQEARRTRLRDAGFDDSALQRIHGPVGLKIGALTTPEIAMAIMGQIIQRWRIPGGVDSGVRSHRRPRALP